MEPRTLTACLRAIISTAEKASVQMGLLTLRHAVPPRRLFTCRPRESGESPRLLRCGLHTRAQLSATGISALAVAVAITLRGGACASLPWAPVSPVTPGAPTALSWQQHTCFSWLL